MCIKIFTSRNSQKDTCPHTTKQEELSIISYQKSPTSHHPGPGRLFNSPLDMDPFPSSLKRSIYITQIIVRVGKWATLCTSCPLTISFNLTKPSDHLTEHWWKSCLSNKHSRSKIIQIVNFLTDKEILFKFDNGIESNFSDSDSDIEVAIPPVTRHSQQV
ncbi:hypothetical protein AVEN_162709-1 [Araneus ventricosus]|uniref:Uncharacterized protein n=1 Tax=Araneus ventricosus TaxID=182803 RepID=A0A4Y2R0G0_ARAVE|nr:hypothetical protein AVEN_162709-1 [Araneus ventricosus]